MNNYNTALRQRTASIMRKCVCNLIVVGLIALGGVAHLSAASLKVAIVAVNSLDSWQQDVQHKLMSTSLFGTVDVIPVTTAATVPSLAQLLNYDAILVYNVQPFTSVNDANTLGDRLADYLDAGGAVVDMIFTNDQQAPLGGRFRTGGYALMAPGPTLSGTPLRLSSHLQLRPLLNGVNSFEGGNGSFFTNGTLASNTLVAAFWDNDAPLVILSQPPAHNRVTLNFFPVSSDAAGGDLWNAQTAPQEASVPGGAFLMGNSLTYAITRRPANGECTFTVSPGSAFVSAVASSGPIVVTPNIPECTIGGSSADSWVHLPADVVAGTSTSPIFFYSVDENFGGPRTTTLRIAGHDFQVEQAGARDFALTPLTTIAQSNQAFDSSVSVTAGAPGLDWTATANAPWLHITSQLPQLGSGPLNYSADANPGLQRVGTLTVAGRTFTVIQGGAACFFTINSQTATAVGGNVAFTASSPGCPWTAVSNTAGLTVTSAASGVGSGSVSFSLAANPSANPRTLTLSVAMQTVTLKQDGTTPQFLVTPSSNSIKAGGGNGTFLVTASPADASWRANSNVPWLTINGSASRVGTDSIQYSVALNPSLNQRVGIITIPGSTFTLTQAAETPAAITAPAPNSTLSGSTVTFTWAAAEDGTEYWLDVGTAPSVGNIFGGNVGAVTSKQVTGLSVNGSPVFVTLYTKIAGSFQDSSGAYFRNSYTYTAATFRPAAIISPTPGSTLAAPTVTFSWGAVPGATEYWLDVGTAPFVGNITAGSVGAATSKQVTGLPVDGSTVFVSLYTKINGSYQDSSGAYIRNSYTYTAMRIGAIAVPAPNSTLGGTTATFTWAAVPGANEYWLDVGTVPFVGNIAAGSVGLATARQVTGLPTDGSTVFATLYTKVNGSYQDSTGAYLRNSYTYTAVRIGAIAVPAPNSVLGGATATFAWPVVPAATEYWLDVGTTPFVGNIFAGSTGAAPAKQITGLPLDGSTVFVTLYTKINGSFQDATGAYLRNSYVYTAATVR